MNIKSIKKQLGKVNALFSVMENEETISSIERDLLKSYVQNLYARIIEDEQPHQSNEKKGFLFEPKDEPKPIVATSPKQFITEKPKKEVKLNSDSEENFSNEFLSDPIDEMPGNYPRQIPVMEQSSNGAATTTSALIAPEANAKSSYASVMDLIESDQKIKTLFAESKSSELSDRLRNTQIKDINAGLGLNERILMVNELFGRSNELFKESIKSLNDFESFAEAKKYLVTNLIEKYGWTEDPKVHCATSFIKLVRRRYI